MSTIAIASLWRTRVSSCAACMRHPSPARVQFLLTHPFRWRLPAVGAFLACSASDVGPKSRWPGLLDRLEQAIADVEREFPGRGVS